MHSHGSQVLLVKGDTFPIRDQLRALGGAWDGARQAWLFHAEAAAGLAAFERLDVHTVPVPADLLVTGDTFPARRNLGPLGTWDGARKAWRIPAECRAKVEEIAHAQQLRFHISETPPRLPVARPQAPQAPSVLARDDTTTAQTSKDRNSVVITNDVVTPAANADTAATNPAPPTPLAVALAAAASGETETRNKRPWEMLESDYLARELGGESERIEDLIDYYHNQIGALSPRARAQRSKLETTLRYYQEALVLSKTDRGRETVRQTRHRRYVETVKKAISTGRPVSDDVVAQYPEFVLARTARQRYEKGRRTSFGNRTVAVDDTTKPVLGAKLKRQDGQSISDDQVKEIGVGLAELEEALGPIRDLIENADITIAHTAGKYPFLLKAGGVYHPSEQTITMGIASKVSGKPIPSLAHEWAHWLDHDAGDRHTEGYYRGAAALSVKDMYNRDNRSGRGLIDEATSSFQRSYEVSRAFKRLTADQQKTLTPEQQERRERIHVALGSYWTQPHEVWARLVEQYVSTKLGRGGVSMDADYPSLPGYWSKEDFARLMPDVEREIRRRIDLVRGQGPGRPIDAEVVDRLRDPAIPRYAVRSGALYCRPYRSDRDGSLTAEERETRELASRIRDLDPEAATIAAEEMSARVPLGAVLVPMPDAGGDTAANRLLAEAIASRVGGEVHDLLGPSAPDHSVARPPAPTGDVYFVDNVLTTGATIEAARQSIGRGRALVFARAADPPDPAIVAGHIQEAFPGAAVARCDQDLWRVDLPGREVYIHLSGDLVCDAAAFHAGYGRPRRQDEQVTGSWVTIDRGGILQLAKNSEDIPATLRHEVFHAAEQLVLTPEEQADLVGHFGSSEAAAEAYAHWRPGDEPLHVLFEKIRAFFERVARALGLELGRDPQPQLWQQAFASIDSGEVWRRDTPAVALSPRATQPTRVPLAPPNTCLARVSAALER